MWQCAFWVLGTVWFAGAAAAAAFEGGILGEGPIVRTLRFMPFQILILLASFGVDERDFGSSTGLLRVLQVSLGFMFAAVAAAGLYLSVVG